MRGGLIMMAREQLQNDAKDFRVKQIQELQAIEKRTEMQEFMLNFFRKQEEKAMTDEEILRDNYYSLLNEYEYWMDLKDEYKNLTALWVIGTYFHDQFITFPILFINAMRGSGKSRYLNLNSNLVKDGLYIHSNLSDPVAFRTKGPLFIDEFESVNSKEKQTLRELLNSSYKKGTKVLRMKETKNFEGKSFRVEEFDVYRPICIANIAGMEEVLSDRCITVILEKSNDPTKTSLVENFETNKKILHLKFAFLSLKCSLCSVVSLQEVYAMWNDFIKDKTTLYTNYTNNNNNTNYTTKDRSIEKFFVKVENSGITGRNLEIFMPLFLIAKMIGDDVLDYTIKTASTIVSERKYEEYIESKDVLLYDFISKLTGGLTYYSVKQLTAEFRIFSETSDDWMNDKWFGRALKRLNLIVDKRRKNTGVEIIPNVAKAKEKIKIFRIREEKENAN